MGATGTTSPPPIFVVGCPRSGTTLMRLVLDAHPNIACGPETHFLADLERITTDHAATLAPFGFDRTYWFERIRVMFGGFHEDYARARGKRRWADKTPRYVLHLDFVDALFPDAQIIHMIRDGRDVVQSQLDKWGWKTALACAGGAWQRHVEAGRRWGSRAPVTRYLEVRYEHLVATPAPILQRVCRFLGEPWDDALLRYHEAPHDGNRHLKRRIAERGAPIYATSVGRGTTGLPWPLRRLIETRSGALLRALGYG